MRTSTRMGSLFGTDGIRGTVGEDLTASTAFEVGRAVALACRDGALGESSATPAVVIGRDTRPSGPMLEDAVISGLRAGGARTVSAGVVPTPAVAYLVAELDASAGIVLSASHNPARDNGIKVFGAGGWKLDPGAEAAIERLIASEVPDGAGGASDRLDGALDRYAAHVATASAGPLDGLRVVVDCANGAASDVAPRVLRGLGAEVEAINASGDGSAINDGCGATFPDVVAERARGGGRIGLTFDGDADRVLAADETGRVVDGDAIIAILAADLFARDRLPGDAVVMTVMTNQAMRVWCAEHAIELVETPVGDRSVLAAMRERGLVLGGEQSGHVIRLDHATTGDGLLTAVCLLDVVHRSGRRLADLVPFDPFPQVLTNVRSDRVGDLADASAVWDAVSAAERALGSGGRVLVRGSGTEPLIRVMVEADSHERAASVASSIVEVVERVLGEGD